VPPGENSPRVLIVEDDQDGRRMYAEWLTGAGFRVEQAHNGLQALDRALRAGCDAVLPKPCGADELESAIRSLIEPGSRDA
jgi:CheY-like chemotaxis protein